MNIGNPRIMNSEHHYRPFQKRLTLLPSKHLQSFEYTSANQQHSAHHAKTQHLIQERRELREHQAFVPAGCQLEKFDQLLYFGRARFRALLLFLLIEWLLREFSPRGGFNELGRIQRSTILNKRLRSDRRTSNRKKSSPLGISHRWRGSQ